jgi:hypothetical protein
MFHKKKCHNFLPPSLLKAALTKSSCTVEITGQLRVALYSTPQSLFYFFKVQFNINFLQADLQVFRMKFCITKNKSYVMYYK